MGTPIEQCIESSKALENCRGGIESVAGPIESSKLSLGTVGSIMKPPSMTCIQLEDTCHIFNAARSADFVQGGQRWTCAGSKVLRCWPHWWRAQRVLPHLRQPGRQHALWLRTTGRRRWQHGCPSYMRAGASSLIPPASCCI